MNITLIGMPASGKSYVGKLLAERLQFTFIELDKVLEERYGMPLERVVQKLGAEKFLDIEAEAVIAETVGKSGLVISPGGSVIYRDSAMEHLHNSSTIIFLDTPEETLLKRIGGVPRGIVNAGNKTFGELYAERVPLYKKWATHVVDGDRHVAAVADDIEALLKQ